VTDTWWVEVSPVGNPQGPKGLGVAAHPGRAASFVDGLLARLELLGAYKNICVRVSHMRVYRQEIRRMQGRDIAIGGPTLDLDLSYCLMILPWRSNGQPK